MRLDGLKKIVEIFSETYDNFLNTNSTKLSSSLAYYTIFSIPPLIIIIISIASYFYGDEAVNGQLYGQIAALVGPKAAIEIQQAVKQAELADKGAFASGLGVVVLILGASGVFVEIQSSINYIWRLQTRPKRGFVRMVKNRILSLSMIVSLGFILLISLIFNAALDFVSNYMTIHYLNCTINTAIFINNLFVFIVVSFLFYTIFSILPDAKVNVKIAVIGSLFTALLFMGGKYILTLYIANTSLSPYTTAESIIVILVWVYYSAIILFFGANFTKVLTEHWNLPIHPNRYSIYVDFQEAIEAAEKKAGKLN